MSSSILPAIPAYDFAAAARAVLDFLHKRLGFDLWMVTRTEGEDWIVLQAEDHNYGVEVNSVFRWADSYCSRMVEGRGPRIAPRSASIAAYLDAPINHRLQIRSYVGVPLTHRDGALFGTLCAIHPAPQPDAITSELPLIELLAKMLSSILDKELAATDAVRRAERAQTDAETDALTGLFNRRGWNRLIHAEDDRCRRYGHPACIVAIDLDGLKAVNDSRGHAAGDQLISNAARAIRNAARQSDAVARVGGDEFTVLAVECSHPSSLELVERIEDALAQAGIAASLGLAMRHPMHGFGHAWGEADKAMYAAKSKAQRSRTASGAA